MANAAEIVASMRSRRNDQHGSGQYGASRGGRTHRGLDVISVAGENVYSPIEGEIVREAVPYANDPSYRGLVIRGSGPWSDYEVKLFYVEGFFCGQVAPGDLVGTAQDLTTKYPGITNHIHVEIRKSGAFIDPFELFARCF